MGLSNVTQILTYRLIAKIVLSTAYNVFFQQRSGTAPCTATPPQPCRRCGTDAVQTWNPINLVLTNICQPCVYRNLILCSLCLLLPCCTLAVFVPLRPIHWNGFLNWLKNCVHNEFLLFNANISNAVDGKNVWFLTVMYLFSTRYI